MDGNRVTKLQLTGVKGLDRILNGGIPTNRLYLLEGNPGTGKTTLGMQFLMEGARSGEKCLYITLSESKEELAASADSHGWSLDGIDILDLADSGIDLTSDASYTVFHPSEVELDETTKQIRHAIDRVKPERVVFDSLSEMRMLAQIRCGFDDRS